MSYILTNPSALSALQSLQQTQTNLATVQEQVSTGLSVSTASDNASYWSIATQLNSDSGVVSAANSALSQSQSVLDTASSAISSVISTIDAINTAVTAAVGTTTAAQLATLNTTLAGLGQQLTDAINGASFNGLNLLNGSQTGTLSFVAGFNATATGGSFNTINITSQALTSSVTTTTTTPQAQITDSTTVANLISSYGTSNSATLAVGTDVITATAGSGLITVESEALDGTTTTTTYQGIDSTGANSTSLTQGTASGDVSAFTETVTTTPGSGLLTQGAYSLTNLTVTSTNAKAIVAATDSALTAVTSYAATIGATQDRITNATSLNSQLTTNYATGVAGLVDANMNTASTQLQALQTQEQLGIQALSIANQNSQLILKLFNG
jgi:flagellin